METYPLCLTCKHFIPNTEIKIKPFSCDAYPSGIPKEIITGTVDHTKPYKGDNGIQYQAIYKTTKSSIPADLKPETIPKNEDESLKNDLLASYQEAQKAIEEALVKDEQIQSTIASQDAERLKQKASLELEIIKEKAALEIQSMKEKSAQETELNKEKMEVLRTIKGKV